MPPLCAQEARSEASAVTRDDGRGERSGVLAGVVRGAVTGVE